MVATASARRPARRPPAAARRARLRRRRVVVLAALLAVLVLVIGGVVTLIGGAVALFDGCRIETMTSTGYNDDQVANATTIVNAGRDLGLTARDQTIAVMTAMGESSLRNLDYGDWETRGIRNPDGTRTTSIGLFQQQDGWGTRDQRMDPYTAATLFYRAMIERVPDRDVVAPTIVAHRVQINQDADHYAPYWPAAVRLVNSITGTDSGLDPGGQASTRCR